jgi:hypothetical protein
VNLAKANEPRFWGARRVENVIPSGQAQFGSGWTPSASTTQLTGQADPFGGTAAVLLTNGNAAYSCFTRVFYTMRTGLPARRMTISGYVKAGTARYAIVRGGSIGADGDSYGTFDLQTGQWTDPIALVPLTTSGRGAQNIGNGWYRIWVSGDYNPATAAVIDFGQTNRLDGNSSIAVADSASAYWYGPMAEEVSTVNLVSAMSEYVPADATIAGSSAVGVRYFDTYRTVSQNLIPVSQGNSNSAYSLGGNTWTESNAVAPDGTTTAGTLNTTLAGANIFQVPIGTLSSGVPNLSPGSYIMSWWAKLGTATSVKYSVIDFDSTNVIAPTEYSGSLNTSTWVRMSVTFTLTASNLRNGCFFCFNRDALSTGTVFLWGFQLRRNLPYIDDTYVPTLLGAGNQKSRNGNSVWSGGTQPIPATVLLGYRYEPAGTQLVATTAAIRNLADASWTTVTMTTSQTVPGVDGIANSATRCTATAALATALQPALILGGGFRFVSFYIKRVTGTGNIDITQNGITGWTTVMSGAGTGGWVRVQMFASVVNPQIGIRIATNGDAIDVDFAQLEDLGSLPHASSPMPTTGASRNPDVLSHPSANNISGSVGTLYCEVGCTEFNNAVGAPSIGGVDASTFEIAVGGGTGQVYSNDGGTVVNTVAGAAWLAATPKKMAVAWGTGARSLAITGGTLLSGAGFDGDFNVGGIRTGQAGATTAAPAGTIRNLRIYGQKLTDAQLTAMVA